VERVQERFAFGPATDIVEHRIEVAGRHDRRRMVGAVHGDGAVERALQAGDGIAITSHLCERRAPVAEFP
jgi:hypothetical protein